MRVELVAQASQGLVELAVLLAATIGRERVARVGGFGDIDDLTGRVTLRFKFTPK